MHLLEHPAELGKGCTYSAYNNNIIFVFHKCSFLSYPAAFIESAQVPGNLLFILHVNKPGDHDPLRLRNYNFLYERTAQLIAESAPHATRYMSPLV